MGRGREWAAVLALENTERKSTDNCYGAERYVLPAGGE
jgi:hypothetical protein